MAIGSKPRPEWGDATPSNASADLALTAISTGSQDSGKLLITPFLRHFVMQPDFSGARSQQRSPRWNTKPVIIFVHPRRISCLKCDEISTTLPDDIALGSSLASRMSCWLLSRFQPITLCFWPLMRLKLMMESYGRLQNSSWKEGSPTFAYADRIVKGGMISST
jgi:hypothetical protein